MSTVKCITHPTVAMLIAVADIAVIVLLLVFVGSSTGIVAWAVYPMILNRVCELGAHCFLTGSRHDSVRPTLRCALLVSCCPASHSPLVSAFSTSACCHLPACFGGCVRLLAMCVLCCAATTSLRSSKCL